MTDYGLATPRNSDGSPKPTDYTYEYDGDDIMIKLIPPTFTDMEAYQNLGADASGDELRGILDDHIVKPETDPEDMTMREVNCYIYGIKQYGSGGTDQMQQAIEELEKRQNAEGN